MHAKDLNPPQAGSRWPIAAFLLALAASPAIRGADPAPATDTSSPASSAVRTTQQDHQALKELLGITSLRPGRNGMNPQATNYANYDESKANPVSEPARAARPEEQPEGRHGGHVVGSATC